MKHEVRSLCLQIRLTDHNDNFPVCNDTLYEATVEENIGVGTIIFTIYATDKDLNNNAMVRWVEKLLVIM